MVTAARVGLSFAVKRLVVLFVKGGEDVRGKRLYCFTDVEKSVLIM